MEDTQDDIVIIPEKQTLAMLSRSFPSFPKARLEEPHSQQSWKPLSLSRQDASTPLGIFPYPSPLPQTPRQNKNSAHQRRD